MHVGKSPHILLAALFLVLVPPVSAQVYKWVDKEGRVHFSDRKPPAGKGKKVTVKVNTVKMVSHGSSATDTGGSVIMYATAWCPYCEKARQYFKKKGIAYIEIDIEKDKAGKREYDRIGGSGVPLILVGKKRMNGFSAAGFERMYKR